MSTPSSIGSSNKSANVNTDIRIASGDSSEQTLREIPKSSFNGADGKRYSVGILKGELVILKPKLAGMQVEVEYKTGEKWDAASGIKNEEKARTAFAKKDAVPPPTGGLSVTSTNGAITTTASVKIPIDKKTSVTTEVTASPTDTSRGVTVNSKLNIFDASVNVSASVTGTDSKPTVATASLGTAITWKDSTGSTDFALKPKIGLTSGEPIALGVGYSVKTKLSDSLNLTLGGDIPIGGQSTIGLTLAQSISVFNNKGTVSISGVSNGSVVGAAELGDVKISAGTNDGKDFFTKVGITIR